MTIHHASRVPYPAMPSILITQSLQRDFVALVGPHEPLPNRLHVGHAEALRLLGPDPVAGPVGQIIACARAQSPDALALLHIRDWHDPDDAAQRDHLAMFGDHCLQGTNGARLVLDLDDGPGNRPHEHVVNASALNDFEGTTLRERLDEVRARAGGAPLRVGVVGVWTEAKVSFLLYDLKTRYGIDELATCSALTASASRAQHFIALGQLERILGVRVFDSVGEFAGWLAPGASPVLPKTPARFGPPMAIIGGEALGVEDREIVGLLYRDVTRVELEPLSGGFSGAGVFKVNSRDAFGHDQAPSVLKIGPHALIASERVAFERVEEVLGSGAPSVRGFVDLGTRAGIKYSLAAMGQGRVRTLKALFEAGHPDEQLETILRTVLEEILGRLYAVASYERCPLLEHYGFSSKWTDSVRQRVRALAGDVADDERLAFPGGTLVTNVVGFYARFLAEQRTPTGEFHYTSFVHGDLNAANVLVDDRANIWVIDFAHTGQGHVLKDVAKVESDLLFILTPLADEDELAQALAITAALRHVEDLRTPLPESLPELRAPALVRAWRCVRALREVAAKLCREDRHPLQMAVARLRYAVHTLSFPESSTLQKRWALATACGFAEDVAATMQSDRVLRVDWLEADALVGRGRVGMTICPGRRDRGRDLGADLDTLARLGVTRLVCLVTHEELEWAAVVDLRGECERRGIALRHEPIRDQAAPGLEDAVALVDWLLHELAAGETVVMHCLGGLGRTGTIAACMLVARGLGADAAILAVRTARDPRAVETGTQEEFVRAFAARMGATRR